RMPWRANTRISQRRNRPENDASYDFIACTVTLMFLDLDTCSGRTRRHAALHPSERLQPDRRRQAYRSLPLPDELFRSRSAKANSALPTTPENTRIQRRSGPHAQRRPTTVRDPARSQRRLTNPSKGLVFPVSALILERIAPYRTTLDAFSKPRWLTSTGTRHRATNVIVAHTIEHTLAEEV